MFRKLTAIAILLLAGSSALADYPADSPERLQEMVHERRADMAEMARVAKTIGTLMRTGEFEAVASPAARLRDLGTAMMDKYRYGSDLPPSRAQPRVFDDYASFRTFIERFTAVADKARVAAETRTDVHEAVANLFKECKTCHDVFLKPAE